MAALESASLTCILCFIQVDPAVSAAVHYVSSLYYKAEQDFAEFYKSSLQYLAFVSSDQLDHEFKLVRADPL
jgi:hypothetical protein